VKKPILVLIESNWNGLTDGLTLAMAIAGQNLAPAQELRRHRWFAAFFTFGATMCALTTGLLLFPGAALDSLWRLNPHAHHAFQSFGSWSIVLMLTVGTGCLFTAIGLWRGTRWGTRLAVVILAVNMIGDLTNALFRHDYRALIGLPGGAAMILYLVPSEASRVGRKL
jgi:hypothetical protein